MTVLTVTTMTVKVATHLDLPVLTVPTDSMMTVVTVDHPHRSDTATMTVVTVVYRVTMTAVLLEASMTITVSVPLTVVTVEGPAHLTVAILESSMTVPVDTMMAVVTVGHPHCSDTRR
jgi:hypothetical protein